MLSRSVTCSSALIPCARSKPGMLRYPTSLEETTLDICSPDCLRGAVIRIVIECPDICEPRVCQAFTQLRRATVGSFPTTQDLSVAPSGCLRGITVSSVQRRQF